MIKFSVLIPTYNNLNYLKLAIDSIKHNSTYEHEIILHINDGSDGTLNFVRTNNYKHTSSDNNIGLCSSLNKAAKLVSNLITKAGADRVVTVDLHAGQIQGFFDIPVDNLYATPIFYRHIKKNLKLNNLVCVSPDVGGVARTRGLSKLLNVNLAIVDKRRPAPGKSEVMNIIGDIKNKICIIVDDIIDSGGTIVNAAKMLKSKGAKEIHVYITHGVLSGDAAKKIKNSPIKKLVITDTIDNSKKINNVKNIEVLSISNLLGEALKRISNSTSVSDLFK